MTPPNQTRSINTYWAYRERKSQDDALMFSYGLVVVRDGRGWFDFAISWNYLHATVTIHYRDETRTNVIETQIIIHSFFLKIDFDFQIGFSLSK